MLTLFPIEEKLSGRDESSPYAEVDRQLFCKGVVASGTLAERKVAHLSLRGCDREAA
jgi:hypothetical protein